MYHSHFGLSGPPFQFTPTPDALYLGKAHREALASLEWGLLHEPTGFSLLVGETGVGKTTLVCSILARKWENMRAAYITNPKLNFDQMMQVAMSQLAPGSAESNKLDLIREFERLLGQLAPGERVAIVIDEAQELDEATLEELRLLSNLDMARERRFQIVFVGQPELMNRLGAPGMRSLNQRIGARALLSPMQPAEAREYIECRLRAKGGSARKIFASAALNHLVTHGCGIPRRINVLCHNTMLLAYVAERKKVNLAMARAAVNEYDNLLSAANPPSEGAQPEQNARPATRLGRTTAVVTALTLAAIGTAYVWSWQPAVSERSSGSGVAIRPLAGLNIAGPRVVLGPVASADGKPAAPTVVFEASADAATSPASSGQSTGTLRVMPDAAGSNRQDRNGATAAAKQRTVRVRYGDTLFKIAARYLGSPDRLDRLLAANPQLRNINRIYPGEVLYLPPARRSASGGSERQGGRHADAFDGNRHGIANRHTIVVR